MARPRYNRPTDAELQILQVFWDDGGCTVREVYNTIKPIRGSGYNAVLKLIQIMHDRGYLERDDTHRPQIYYAVIGESATKRLLLKDLMNRVFDGNIGAMITHLLALKKLTPEQVNILREQLNT